MRKALAIGAVVLLLLGGAALFLLSSLDGIVKTVIVDAGSRLAGSRVAVASVHISLSQGSGGIAGVTVANPEGFSANAAISLGEISLVIDKDSVGKNPVIIKRLQITAPAIRYEIGAQGSNLDHLRKALAAHRSGGGNDGGGGSGGRRLVIEKLVVSQGQVTLAAPGLPAATAPLAEIELTDIGSGQGGVDAAQLGDKLLQALLDGASRSAASWPGALGKVGDQLKSLKDLLPH